MIELSIYSRYCEENAPSRKTITTSTRTNTVHNDSTTASAISSTIDSTTISKIDLTTYTTIVSILFHSRSI